MLTLVVALSLAPHDVWAEMERRTPRVGVEELFRVGDAYPATENERKRAPSGSPRDEASSVDKEG